MRWSARPTGTWRIDWACSAPGAVRVAAVWQSPPATPRGLMPPRTRLCRRPVACGRHPRARAARSAYASVAPHPLDRSPCWRHATLDEPSLTRSGFMQNVWPRAGFFHASYVFQRIVFALAVVYPASFNPCLHRITSHLGIRPVGLAAIVAVVRPLRVRTSRARVAVRQMMPPDRSTARPM